MFLWEDAGAESRYREGTQAVAERSGTCACASVPTYRFLSECEKLQRDNAEFNISVLDSRYLGGDRELFERLRSNALPHMIGGAWSDLVSDLSELTSKDTRKKATRSFTWSRI